MTRSRGCIDKFMVYGNVVKHCLKSLIYLQIQTECLEEHREINCKNLWLVRSDIQISYL